MFWVLQEVTEEHIQHSDLITVLEDKKRLIYQKEIYINFINNGIQSMLQIQY